jgi:hypothetical protein
VVFGSSLEKLRFDGNGNLPVRSGSRTGGMIWVRLGELSVWAAHTALEVVHQAGVGFAVRRAELEGELGQTETVEVVVALDARITGRAESSRTWCGGS